MSMMILLPKTLLFYTVVALNPVMLRRFFKPDVDGGLIGGASLNCEDFIAIVKAI